MRNSKQYYDITYFFDISTALSVLLQDKLAASLALKEEEMLTERYSDQLQKNVDYLQNCFKYAVDAKTLLLKRSKLNNGAIEDFKRDGRVNASFIFQLIAVSTPVRSELPAFE